MPTDNEIVAMSRKTLEQGLYFGNGHVTRATDAELISFARQLIAPYEAELENYRSIAKLMGAERA